MTTRTACERTTDLPSLLQRLRRELYAAGQPVPSDLTRLLELIPDVSGAFPEADATIAAERPAGRPRVVVSRNGLTGPTRTLAPYWNDLIRAATGTAGEALRGIIGALQAAVLQADDAVVRGARPWDSREWLATETDPFAVCVLAFLGPEIVAAIRRIGVPADAIVRHAGAFLRPPTAEGLGALLSDVFDFPVRARCRGNRVRLRVGPVRRAVFESLCPGEVKLTQLLQLARLHAGDGPRFEVELRLHPADVQTCGEASPDELIPGWNCWAVTPGHRTARMGVTRIGAWRCSRLLEDSL